MTRISATETTLKLTGDMLGSVRSAAFAVVGGGSFTWLGEVCIVTEYEAYNGNALEEVFTIQRLDGGALCVVTPNLA